MDHCRLSCSIKNQDQDLEQYQDELSRLKQRGQLLSNDDMHGMPFPFEIQLVQSTIDVLKEQVRSRHRLCALLFI
jgi:hypothetical protein